MDEIISELFGKAPDREPDFQHRHEDGTTWKLWISSKGSKSQGLSGYLYDSGGSEIKGTEIKEKKKICGVCYIWEGEFGPGKLPWDSRGWIPKGMGTYSDPHDIFKNIK